MEEIKNKKNFKDYLNQARNFDGESFEIIYSKYLSPVYRYFIVRTADENLSRDLSQLVFMKAWENIVDKNDDRNDIDRQKILPWLFTIAKNTLIDYWRKKKEIFVDDLEVLEASGDKKYIEEDYDYSQRLKDVRSALIKLSEEQREMITLKFFDGLANDEICQILGKSSSAVRALQFRAIKALKEILLKNKK